jgi:hypothetical protein
MPLIKMKILKYEEETNSLIVVFASENSQKSIDEYPVAAFQPTMFDSQDPEKVIEHIARAGIFVAQKQDKDEQFKNNPDLAKKYQEYIGKELVFDVDTLLQTADQIVEHRVEYASIVDEILEEIVIDNIDDTQKKSD